MCGLFGFLRHKSNGIILRDYLQNMTLAGSLRGSESVGYYFGAPNFGQIEKFPVNGATIAYSKVMPQLASMASTADVVMGHHRASTHGEISTVNCHPFQRTYGETTIIGTHNGVISSFNRKEDGRDFVVDSDWATYKLAQLGDDAFKLFDGAFALSYFNPHTGKLTLTCNDQRPLCFAFVAKQNAVFYASEWGMLQWVAARNGIDLEDITVLDAMDKYVFDFGNPRSVEKGEVPAFEKPKSAVTVHSGRRGGYHGGACENYDYGDAGEFWPAKGASSRPEYREPATSHLFPELTVSEALLVEKSEADLAASLGLLGEYCQVSADRPEDLSDRSSACMAVATYNDDIERAVIRGINKHTVWKIARAKTFTAKIIGARWASSAESKGEKEFRLIVSEPVVVRINELDTCKKQFLIDSELAHMSKAKAGNVVH